MMNSLKNVEEKVHKFSANNYHPLPVVLEKGEGVWVYDTEGKKYFDCLSAYSALNQGHRHPKIIEAAIKQMSRITLTSRAFHNDQMGDFLELLCNMSKFDSALPMNSGAEAVETAIKAARKWGYKFKKVDEDKAEIIVCRDNFHGRTTTIVSFSTEPQYKDGFGPFTPGFKVIPYGDAKALEAAITKNTVAFLVEPIQGEAGILIPPTNFLTDVRSICNKHNVLMILDEIQTGLGRTGKFFAYQHDADAKPDVICIGKALGGGIYPVSAMLSNREVMSVFKPGDHGSTFGGNPLASAIAKASLEVIRDEKLVENSAAMGALLVHDLKGIPSPHVKEVRGKGLMIGVEIKMKTTENGREVGGPARPFCEHLMKLGLLAKETHGQVIRLAPPLTVTKEDVNFIVSQMREVLK